MVFFAALLAVLCTVAAAHDIHRRRAHFGDLLFMRDSAPRRYWALVGLWGLCIVGCTGVIVDEMAKNEHAPPVTVVMMIPENS